MPGNESIQAIRLKLLSENNVILAKCNGLETEVFMPAVIDGRISIINVIPQRRCNCISTTHLVGKKNRPGPSVASPSDTLTNWRVSLASTLSTQRKNRQQASEPLANSTPAQLQANTKKTNSRSVLDKTTSMSFPSPEPMRRALVEMNDTCFIAPIRRPIKRRINKPLNFNNCIADERDVVSPVSFASNVSIIDAPTGNLSDMALPKTPPPIRKKNVVNDTIDVSSPDTLQWRKVMTPVRTYARQSHAFNRTCRPLTDDVPKHHLENRTQAPNVSHLIVHKVNRVLIDQKTAISPRSFKQQMQCDPPAKLSEDHRKDLHSFYANMPRKTAFDLLTNPSSKSNCTAKELKTQFRNRCVNKASSTYPKYKKLCATTPLEVQFRLNTQLRNPLKEVNCGTELSNFRVSPLIAPKSNDSTYMYQLKSASTATQGQTTLSATSSDRNNVPLNCPFSYKIVNTFSTPTTSDTASKEFLS